MKCDYDFQVLNGKNADVQKTLNQWKHQFKIKIHSFNSFENGTCTVFLIRIVKAAK